jgi:hypothetical protein
VSQKNADSSDRFSSEGGGGRRSCSIRPIAIPLLIPRRGGARIQIRNGSVPHLGLGASQAAAGHERPEGPKHIPLAESEVIYRKIRIHYQRLWLVAT